MQGDRQGDGDDSAAWPPRVDAVPAVPFAGSEPLDLRIDAEAAVVEGPGFTPSKLTARERQQLAESDECQTQAVVFDPKNPSGRTAHDRIFDATDEDFRRTRRRVRRESGMAGAFVFLVVLAGFQPPGLLAYAMGALIGCAAGMAAEAMGDRCETWLLAALVGALPMALVVEGPVFLIVFGALAGGGWLTGFVREVR